MFDLNAPPWECTDSAVILQRHVSTVADSRQIKRLDTVATPTPRGVRVFVMSVGAKGFYCLLVLGLTGLGCVFG